MRKCRLTVIMSCVLLCYSKICSTTAFWLKRSVFSEIISCFLGFDSWISLKAFHSKLWRIHFFAALALSALRRLRVQSDLLVGTAFEALSLVVCTKGPMYKNSVGRHFAPSFYFLGIADLTSICCWPVLFAHAALHSRLHPDHTHH